MLIFAIAAVSKQVTLPKMEEKIENDVHTMK